MSWFSKTPKRSLPDYRSKVYFSDANVARMAACQHLHWGYNEWTSGTWCTDCGIIGPEWEKIRAGLSAELVERLTRVLSGVYGNGNL